MVQYFDHIFKPITEEERPKGPNYEELMNSTQNLEWLVNAQHAENQEKLKYLTEILEKQKLAQQEQQRGGTHNLSNEILTGKAMSVRESRRKSYFQRQQREYTPSDSTPMSDDTSDCNEASPNVEGDSIAQLLLKMKRDDKKEESNATSIESPQEEGTSGESSATPTVVECK